MDLPVPPRFRFQHDVAAADWFVSSLKPWGRDRIRLWSFLPDTFEAYARFPNHVDDDRDVEGDLDQPSLKELARLLERSTGTPDRCWIAAWVGWGSWGPGSSSALTAFAERPARKRRPFRRRERRPLGARMREVEQASRETHRRLNALPQIKVPAREYFLFSATVADVPAFAVGGFPHAPSIWWPDDRAWCVATEVDGYVSFVGGSHAAIDAVLGSAILRAAPITPDTPIDGGGRDG